MADDDKIKPLPVKFKQPPGVDPPFLVVVSQFGKDRCNHRYRIDASGHTGNATYQIREGEPEIECGLCQTRLDPMFVLRIMAHEENSWSRARLNYIDEMKRLKERSRTKCWHCGKMTEISRK
jgi:hypothetical protein